MEPIGQNDLEEAAIDRRRKLKKKWPENSHLTGDVVGGKGRRIYRQMWNSKPPK